MLTMDVFNQDAFSAISLTGSIDQYGYVPGFLGSQGVFVSPPLGQPETEAIWIESRLNAPALIQTTPRGAPIEQLAKEKRDARAFKTRRLAEGQRITASEIQGIRAFGTTSELEQLVTKVVRAQNLIQNNFELTKENLRLGAVQGLLLDADGTTIYDWASEFGQTIPAEVDFNLDAATPAPGALRILVTAAVRSMTRALKGMGGNAVRFMAVCGDDFWDALIAHTEVRATYLSYAAAAALRDPVAWESFNFGGVTFTNYRGTDDASTVAVGAAKAKFFPVNAGIFQEVYSPGEQFSSVNGPGLPAYALVVRDLQRDMWADVEMYSYPLMVCTMPAALYRAKLT